MGFVHTERSWEIPISQAEPISQDMATGSVADTSVVASNSPTLYTPQKAQNAPVSDLKGKVYAMLQEEGISTVTANCVIKNESSWIPENTHFNPAYTDKYGKYHPPSWDVGLWMINDVHGLTWEERLDPIKATEFAIYLRKRDGWYPWVAWRTKCK